MMGSFSRDLHGSSVCSNIMLASQNGTCPSFQLFIYTMRDQEIEYEKKIKCS